MADFVFLDTETLGLDPYAPIWEIAAVRVDGRTSEETGVLSLQVQHERDPWFDGLPESFQNDYRQRYVERRAVRWTDAAEKLVEFMHGKPLMIGSNPSFDAERIARQWLEPIGVERPWHYHVFDIADMVVGYLTARTGVPSAPWKSDTLSAAVGVDPSLFARHTAMGDVRWTMAQWKRVTGLTVARSPR